MIIKKAFSKFCLIGFILLWGTLACNAKEVNNKNKAEIIIENAEMRLVFENDGKAKSLIHKATGQECLMGEINLPAFSITQDMPYDNEIKLTYPAKPKTFEADTLYREGDNLIVGFELTDYEAVINLNVTKAYIGFNLEKFRYKMAKIGDKRKTKIDEFVFLQLPIKNRKHFGEWLNVSWDDKIAVNLLATNQYCRIDAEKRTGYKIFQAGGENEVRMTNIGAALITTDKNKILDSIDKVEHDYNLPLGVESRRCKEYRNSTYTPRGILTVENIREHIAFAKQAGLKNIMIYYPSFATTMGHFNWRHEYPNGMDDLKEITKIIKDAGLIPGLHFHYNKTTFSDSYVSPIPDGRLNLRKYFTLRESISDYSKTIIVEENPVESTLEDGRRVLKIGNELITYENYTTKVPYKFLNCKRGAFNTKASPKEKGTLLGILDVDTWPVFVRFNQNTDIQDEVAIRVANIIDECGFKSLYFDGAEDVNPPFWYNVAKAQLNVYDAIKAKPLYAAGALKPHFSWHILTRGNGYDTFYPEDIKEGTRKYTIEGMKFLSNDFSVVKFGLINYVGPGVKTRRSDVDYHSPKMEWSTPVIKGETTMGIQPDMLEYIEANATAWNSHISLVGNLDVLKSHPRNNDNLEVIRRWEKVKEINFLSDSQKENIKNNTKQEHILLVNETGKFELLPYKQITENSSKVRAFIFERKGKTWVVYWHISGSGKIELPVSLDKVKLYKDLGDELAIEATSNGILLPVGDRRYLEFDLTNAEVINLFSKLTLR